MSSERKRQRFTFVPGVALMPEEFGARLVRLKEASGLTWDGFATAIGVDIRQVLRWRKKGCEPAGGAMLALVDFAIQVPGGLAIITGRDVVVVLRGME
ncbi:MAG: helix-turn-helix domain-containing protein [Chloroflexota bacterium]|nr:helix-turn-helix domain-containing protein [Chloroflexota bacterium]